jgi:putative isomerase
MLDANYFSDHRFRADAGVRSLSNMEPMYALDFSSAPSNWLGPVWIIANYFVWKGLKKYGYTEAAAELADKTIQTLAADLARNGSLDEYYHPDTGAPLSHHGFLDWNMLVMEMF